MTALRRYARDVLLLRATADAACAPLEPDDALECASRLLVRDDGPALVSATWAHLRWTPGVGTTAAYDVETADGRTLRLAIERRREPRRTAPRAASDPRCLEELAGLVPFARPDKFTELAWFPVDRGLPGARRLADASRTRRLLAPCFGDLAIRGRRTRLVVLRHKPGQRAVARLDLALRDATGAKSERTLAVRVLPPRRLAENLRARRAVDAIATRVIATDERAGLLFEEWIDARSVDREDVARAADVAGILVRLHRAPCRSAAVERHHGPLLELLSVDPALARSAAAILASASVRSPRVAWIHGDVHVDQCVERADGGLALLDWDALRAGDPAEDLVELWIDARLAGADDERVLHDVLARYTAAGGEAPGREVLASHARVALVRRAAAAIRRLQSGALDEARRILAVAREVRA